MNVLQIEILNDENLEYDIYKDKIEFRYNRGKGNKWISLF